MEYLKMNFTVIKNVLFHFRFKNHLMTILNTICLLVLFYNAIDMTFDYLSFNYSYKLIVDDNKEGFGLPEISVCTENTILFDKNKVIQYFGVNYFWEMYRIEVKNFYQFNGENSTESIIETCTSKFINHFLNGYRELNSNRRMNFCLNKFFRKYWIFLFDETNFDEMNSMTIRAKELFECSANIHFKYETIDSNITQIDNCFERLNISKSIYANNDFGICYTFFVENNYLFLKNNDEINIRVKFEKQKNFMIVNRSIHLENTIWHSDRYFLWYVRLEDRDSGNRETAIELKKVGFEAQIIVEMTSIELLSTPYMPYCVNNGEFMY